MCVQIAHAVGYSSIQFFVQTALIGIHYASFSVKGLRLLMHARKVARRPMRGISDERFPPVLQNQMYPDVILSLCRGRELGGSRQAA